MVVTARQCHLRQLSAAASCETCVCLGWAAVSVAEVAADWATPFSSTTCAACLSARDSSWKKPPRRGRKFSLLTVSLLTFGGEVGHLR